MPSARLLLFVATVAAPPASAAGTETPAITARRVTAAILPPHSADPFAAALAIGIADRAGTELFATGSHNHLHVKQILSMARQHGLEPAALADETAATTAATLLGADVGAFGQISRTGDGFLLEMSVFDLRSPRLEPLRLPLPDDAAVAVASGGRAVAAAVAALDGVPLPQSAGVVHPDTPSDDAMRAFLDCFSVLVRQPMGLRKSHVVEAETLKGARVQCEKAVALDPNFSAAWAALSFAQALSFLNDEAARSLATARAAPGYLPFAPLAHYWLATRFKGNTEGAEVLRTASRSHPGALIFLTYLGEHLNIAGAWAEALEVWDRYLAAVATSPYVLAQKGYSLARLGRVDEAIELSRQASRMDPQSLELKLELASRLVDAKALTEAEAVLLPLARHPKVFGEIELRLGYVYMLQKRDDLALEHLNRALALALGPSEWRTRGRTYFDLAIIMARRNELAKAEDHLLAAAREGFLSAELLEKDADLKPLRQRPRIKGLFKSPKAEVNPSLLYVTPFPTDALGVARPDAQRPPSAPGFTF